MENEKFKKPFERSYWVVPGKVMAGRYPGDREDQKAREKVRAILDCGVRCCINLIDENSTDLIPYSPYLMEIAEELGVDATYVRFPIVDLSIPTETTMRIILDTIDNALQKDLPVYIHCMGGIGRTGTVVACWLIRHGLATIDDFLDVIHKLREEWNEPYAVWVSPETYQQQEFVWNWKKGM